VRKSRSIPVCLLLLVLAGAAGWAGSADRPIAYEIVGKDVKVETALASYVFSADGGVLKSVYLGFAPYGSSVAELVPGTRTDPKTRDRQYVAGAVFPFVLEGDGAPASYVLGEPTRPAPSELLLEFRGQAGDLVIVKRYLLRNDAYYTVDLEVVVENRGAKDAALRLLLGSYLPKPGARSLVYQFDGVAGEDVLAEASYRSFDGVGLLDKQTVFFLKAAPGAAPFRVTTPAGDVQFGTSLAAKAGTTSSYELSLYGGRRRFLLMEHVGLGKLDAPGIGARLMIPVIQFLELLYRATRNFGWAIILFTLLTRIILFPLVQKQSHSMAKMQRLQPQLKKLQERFKDDRQLMQQKLMELYKKEGMNPLAGCLPLLIQLPILILLWKAILYSAEQIHLSPGFLWLSDLSLMDPYFILVVLTTLVMILQQWLLTPTMPGETSGSQKYLGYIFPVVMAVFLYNFPAGLWLYYFLSTGLAAGQQFLVNRQLAHAEAVRAAAAAAAGEGEEKGDATDGERQAGN